MIPRFPTAIFNREVTGKRVTRPIRHGKPFLVFGAPQILQPEIDEVVASMRAAWLGTGPKVGQFEADFAAYKGTLHAIAVNSCTAAMHLSLLALGIGPGDEVITTAMTFAATVNVIIHTGATPVLADVEPTSLNIDPDAVRRAITPRTKAILPVHFAGRPCDMEQITNIAAQHNLAVIEDCAHAIETEYRGKKAGTFGALGCFSFYATKNVTTGEGGMVVTDEDHLANEIKVQALHGMSRDAWRRYSDAGFRHYEVVAPGFKYNMMDLQAAIGIHQLRRVEANWQVRKEIWARYTTELADLPITLPAPVEPNTRHAFHLFTVLVDEARSPIGRDAFLDAMTEQGIGVGVHYQAIPQHPFYRKQFGWRPADFPTAWQVGRTTVSLPLSARLTNDDVSDVIQAVQRTLS